VVAGSPSYINMLDALNGWQLVLEASRALRRPAAASFKHVSPAGAAVAGPVDDVTAGLYGIDPDGVGALTRAYLRARDADPKSSYGDFAAVSHPVDTELAELLSRVICDGIIAPGYAPGTVATLSRKKSGRFLVMEADEAFAPPVDEAREVFGLRLRQQRDPVALHPRLLDEVVCGELPATAAEDLLLGLALLRYTLVAAPPSGGPRARLPAWPPAAGPHQLADPLHRGRPDPGRERPAGRGSPRAGPRADRRSAQAVAGWLERGRVRLRWCAAVP
jgi:phosphoribosylaminoimidazolecarboxamide formyltransferase / IMP cyclohydrolase